MISRFLKHALAFTDVFLHLAMKKFVRKLLKQIEKNMV